ncbi:MAG: hypothetical protein C0410_10585 [Anaerolinea sp.]|nr:hypothetical protein [Anaerolinea sp.]
MIPQGLPINVDQPMLDRIIFSELKVPADHQAMDFLPGLMTNLGSSDSNLRECSLDVLWAWISRYVYNDGELINIAQQMVSNLTTGLGNRESDSVFLRAFSALILAATLEVDIDRHEKSMPFLFTEDQVRSWLGVTLRLLREERDLRGYVEDKGWAHCPAHTGDLLSNFAIHPYLGKQDLEEILNALQVRITIPVEQVFIHNEEERLSGVVMNILQRDLVSEEFFATWLEGFVSPSGHMDWKEAFTHPHWNCARVNTKMFLRSIYFFLLVGYKDQPEHRKVDMVERLKPILMNCLKQIYPNSRYADWN